MDSKDKRASPIIPDNTKNTKTEVVPSDRYEEGDGSDFSSSEEDIEDEDEEDTVPTWTGGVHRAPMKKPVTGKRDRPSRPDQKKEKDEDPKDPEASTDVADEDAPEAGSSSNQPAAGRPSKSK